MDTEDKSKLSDGYHTFEELYMHRAALFIALANAYPNQSWRSKLHCDGTMYPGFFIAGMNLSQYEHGAHFPIPMQWIPISYHLENRYWPFLEQICTFDFAPDWDGHTSNNVAERLLRSVPLLG